MSTPVTAAPSSGQAQRVAPGVALQVRKRLAFEVSEELQFLREESAATRAQETGEVPAVAVVRPHHRVPREPVLLSEACVPRPDLLHRSPHAQDDRSRHDALAGLAEAGHGVLPAGQLWLARRRAAADIRSRRPASPRGDPTPRERLDVARRHQQGGLFADQLGDRPDARTRRRAARGRAPRRRRCRSPRSGKAARRGLPRRRRLASAASSTGPLHEDGGVGRLRDGGAHGGRVGGVCVRLADELE